MKRLRLSILLIFFSIPLFLGIGFSFYTFFWTPNDKKARDLIRSTSGYYPPTTSKLLYSKNYWESLDGKEPRSMCFVFRYSQQDIITLQNYDFFYDNNKKESHLHSPVPIDKGCAKFRSRFAPINLTLLNKYFESLRPLEGATIYVNEVERFVMFEIYLFD